MNCAGSCRNQATDCVRHTLGLSVKQNLEAQVVVEVRLVHHCCWLLLHTETRGQYHESTSWIRTPTVCSTSRPIYPLIHPYFARSTDSSAEASETCAELTSADPTNPSGNPSEYTVFWSMSRNLVAAGKLSMILNGSMDDVSAPSVRRGL